MLRLVDGNNYFRRTFETSGPDCLQQLYLDACNIGDDVVIWVWDGPGSTKARKALCPEYKGTRQYAGDEFYATTKLFKELLTHSRVMQIEVPDYEADDVIAVLAKGTTQKVHIHSTDKDFLTLTQYAHITCDAKPIEGVGPREMRLFKTLVGDTSDNIKGIPGFGEKSYLKLTPERKRMLAMYFAGKDVYSPEEMAIECFTKRIGDRFVEGLDTLCGYWDVVGFMPVSVEVVNQYLKCGVYNRPEAKRIFDDLCLPFV